MASMGEDEATVVAAPLPGVPDDARLPSEDQEAEAPDTGIVEQNQSQKQQATEPVNQVPQWVDEIRRWIQSQDPLLLDVRSAFEVAMQPVPSAIHIDINELANELPKLLLTAAGRPIGPFCAHGIRSQVAVELLEDRGCVTFNCHSSDVVQFALSAHKGRPRRRRLAYQESG
eukprot:CAMPEP_0204335654 /NCGR_PEP_ID=MMETSP0469-20131031/18948_1 /ASSEMBLY_ACC=CAM_ASM_000384 /TAXON_ID=2969 /ORGANISM="Oxyrrhis marina" /LENGTH=171 /DNA_ID=CAMNT_0051319365 /DNA_START=80 /DNA_END=596 /DNA_ORIENTATION=-